MSGKDRKEVAGPLGGPALLSSVSDKLVGKRVLLRERKLHFWTKDNIFESRIIEVSPSTRYVKLEIPKRDDFYSTRKEWVDGDDYLVLEVLD